MTVIEALGQIRGGRTAEDCEGPTLEFKQEAGSLKETGRILADAVLCLANAAGGSLVLGVADRIGGPSAFIGTALDIDVVRKLVYERTQPRLTVDVRAEMYAGQRLLVITVPEGIDVHADGQGRALRRIGRECRPMTPDDQVRLREERMGYDWSAAPSNRARGEVSGLALEAIRSRLSLLPDDRRQLATASDGDVLRALGVMDGQGRLLRAGEVLLCGPDARGPDAIVYQYRVTPGGEPTAVERISGPLILAFLRALELVDARRNMTPLALPDGQQISVQDFPDLAVREALANAVIHRDYRLRGPVTIDHSRQTLVVGSPGALVSGVTPQNILTHPSKPRNAALTGAFRAIGLAEEIGRGVDRIYREMLRAGGAIPQITDSGDGVRVALLSGNHNERMTRFLARLPQDEREDTDTMLILFTLCSRQTITAPAMTSLLQKGPEETEMVLRRLSSDPLGLLEPTRGTLRRRNPAYRLRGGVLQALGPAVRYQRRTVDEIDRKVISHVQEYGTITNRTLRNIFDIEIHPAKDIIKALTERGILVKVSDRERGPNIEYGPGPSFPTSRKRKTMPERERKHRA